MQVQLNPAFSENKTAKEAAGLLQSCVHCGFCNATCPTYQDLFDERDGPRGRIYLIKHMLESGEAGDTTRTHLDRCLTCRACETTCPSGVQYGRIADAGRELMETVVSRSIGDRFFATDDSTDISLSATHRCTSEPRSHRWTNPAPNTAPADSTKADHTEQIGLIAPGNSQDDSSRRLCSGSRHAKDKCRSEAGAASF